MRILFSRIGAAQAGPPALANLPGDALSGDWRQSLSEIRRLVGPRVLQATWPPGGIAGLTPNIQRRTAVLVEQGKVGGRIVNLGVGFCRWYRWRTLGRS